MQEFPDLPPGLFALIVLLNCGLGKSVCVGVILTAHLFTELLKTYVKSLKPLLAGA